ncbi:MAG: hypothetical protein E7170_01635 [Firmicutes bacterium]|nr:hypothetical protein [Bacillota bacterium]
MKKKLIVVIMFILLYIFITPYFKNYELKKPNNDFVNRMLKKSNYYFYPNDINGNWFSSFINFINNIDINKPLTIVEKKFYRTSNINIEFGYIQNDIVDKPKVFIYSTHPNEKFSDGKTIIEASHLLQTKLNELGVMTIVSERSVDDYLANNNLDFNDSYQATRQFLKDALNEYDSLELIIDLHRDGTTKEISTATIDGKDYAKIMFVMDKRLTNIEFAKKLDNIILSKANITRGIYDKRNYHFNQDLNDKVVLIEMGGNNNNFSEVENSIDILAQSIKELIDEKG